MDIKRIHKVEEIKQMISLDPDFFPSDQEKLDKCSLFLVDGFCYVGFRPVLHHQCIAEMMIQSAPHQKGSLKARLFAIVLQLAKEAGFERVALFFKNQRLKNIFLKKRVLIPWGNGWFLVKEKYRGQ